MSKVAGAGRIKLDRAVEVGDGGEPGAVTFVWGDDVDAGFFLGNDFAVGLLDDLAAVLLDACFAIFSRPKC